MFSKNLFLITIVKQFEIFMRSIHAAEMKLNRRFMKKIYISIL